MRLLFAVHGYKPAYRIGGPIYSVSTLAEGLVQRGHHVVVHTTNSNLDEDLDVPTDQATDVNGVEVWYFKRTAPLKKGLPFLSYFAKSLGYLYAPRMPLELERTVPTMDLVHTHMPFNYPTYAAARAATRHGKPLFYHQRGVFDPERLRFRALKKKLYLELVEKPIMRRATSLIALTRAEVDSYHRLGISTACSIVPNGIHVETHRRESALAVLPEVPKDAPLILFMGRIHPTKGADVLLSAFSRISTVIRDAVLVLAGPDEFMMEQRFRETARDHGTAGRVLFVGMVSGERKQALLARASVFCLPSIAEGFSIAALEALASGVPVVLSPGCHFHEAETAGAGRVVARDADSIADTVIELLRNPERLREMGTRGRALVQQQYSWTRVVDQMVDVYKEGVARHHRTRSIR